ncbi:MAG TPA: hypothetical protein DCL65_01680 [Chryseobacterium sp.]|uniref:DoxX family protein n=1 Tax=Kaistella yananensis TaxID=2989820 RepID=A0ABT3JJT3_9FLAO|nr:MULTISPECIES: hypothetical protein [Chryseobacterium group]MCW4450986.1 hypothetical protein [Kaistella yananensis]OWR14979.1 hypothetical protein CDW55_00625 [Chryseobacterium sp. VAUSW3]HAI79725.1 hypothetical protein [Chryseobacterium sp.]
MNEEFSNESPKKDLGFILSLSALLLFTLMGIGIDSDEYVQQNDLNIPGFYFILIFLIDLLMIIGLILIFFYRKMGVYMFPAAVVLHFFLHNFYLSTFLYTDVTNLFIFISVGLLAFIPKWQFFK